MRLDGGLRLRASQQRDDRRQTDEAHHPERTEDQQTELLLADVRHQQRYECPESDNPRILDRMHQHARLDRIRPVREQAGDDTPRHDRDDMLQRVHTREDAAKVLDVCPDAQWRLLFALSRYGGLRCPSEHLALQWGDVDWERARITVHSPKTEHHEGKAERVVPLFPELRPYLQAAWDELLTDFDPKKNKISEQPIITRYRDSNSNLRTQLCRIIKRAGLEVWPKLFQNLRSTRETELAETFPIHVVCSWIGNSEAVAAKHYLQTTDAHFELAASEPTGKLHADLHQDLQSASAADSKASFGKPPMPVILGNLATYSAIENPLVAEAGVEPARGLLPNGF
jgi:integrase